LLPSAKTKRRKLSGDKNEPNRQRKAGLKTVRRNEPCKSLRIKRQDNEERRLQKGVPENDGSELELRIEKHAKEKDEKGQLISWKAFKPVLKLNHFCLFYV
jgi:hypothetical protein